MNQEWIVASAKASQPMTWKDRLTIAVLIGGVLIAVFGWLIFDGTRAL